MKTQKLLALILSVAALLAVNVNAAAAETTSVAESTSTEIAPLVLEDMERIIVTSSDSKINGSHKVATANFFDGNLSTGCTFVVEEDVEEVPEENEAVEAVEVSEEIEEELKDCGVENSNTLSIYTATRVPEALQAIAGLFDGEKGTILGISVYATNDSLLIDWKQLTLKNPIEKIGEYDVLRIANYPQKYSFYRIDITVEEGSGFTLNELLLYKNVTNEPITYYESDGEVEAGETPELVEIPRKKDPPQFGLFLPYGIMRQSGIKR